MNPPSRPLTRWPAVRTLGAGLALAAACASPPQVRMSAPAPAAATPVPESAGPRCSDCGTTRLESALVHAIERRLADLKARGGQCAAYGAVLEQSYRGGRITLRPYMWRVGTQLASGEARPDGRMVLAREIDSLNVGVRTIDDVLWTLEHEAAHIAFRVSNGVDAEADRANAHVRGCRG